MLHNLSIILRQVLILSLLIIPIFFIYYIARNGSTLIKVLKKTNKQISPVKYALISAIVITIISFIGGLFVIFTSIAGTAAFGLVFLPGYSILLGSIGFIVTWGIISLYVLLSPKHRSNRNSKENPEKE